MNKYYKNEIVRLRKKISLIIISIISLLIVIYMITHIEDKNGIFFIIVFILVYFFVISFFIKDLYLVSKVRKKNKNIINNGNKYEGYIESFDYNVYYKKLNEVRYEMKDITNKVKEYKLNILYDNGKRITTSSLNFSPFELSSRKCIVYILNNEVYVGNYELDSDKEMIWKKSDLDGVNDKDKLLSEETKRVVIIGLIFFGIFVIFLLIIFTLQNK